MPTVSPASLERSRQRAGLLDDVGSVLGTESVVLGSEGVPDGANAMVAVRVSTVALLASDSFS